MYLSQILTGIIFEYICVNKIEYFHKSFAYFFVNG